MSFQTRPTFTASTRHRATRLVATGALAAIAMFGLSACTSSSTADDAAAASSHASHGEAAHSALTLEQAWAKSATSGMSAAFGVLTNASEQPVTLVSAKSPAADAVELHEMAMVDGAMVMRELEGGLEIPAGGTRELSPGGEHLMFIGLTSPLLPGDDVTVTLTFSDGSSLDVVIPVRDTSGANEEYAPGEEHSGTDSMDGMHGESEHADDATAH